MKREAISVRQLCSAIDDHAVFVLEEIKQIRLFEANSAIYRRGEAAASIYVLLEGRAVLMDQLYLQHSVRPGILCGMLEALSGEPYASELTALTPCICSVIERVDLIEFLRRRPIVGLRLSQMISRDYHCLAESIRN
ncbi:MAG TPA: cyclic nucleotide-binding domain-containing protein [Pyrinomonadaceae bacterium]